MKGHNGFNIVRVELAHFGPFKLKVKISDVLKELAV